MSYLVCEPFMVSSPARTHLGEVDLSFVMLSALFHQRFSAAGSRPSNSCPLPHHHHYLPLYACLAKHGRTSSWWVRRAETKSRNLPCAADLLENPELMVRLR